MTKLRLIIVQSVLTNLWPSKRLVRTELIFGRPRYNHTHAASHIIIEKVLPRLRPHRRSRNFELAYFTLESTLL